MVMRRIRIRDEDTEGSRQTRTAMNGPFILVSELAKLPNFIIAIPLERRNTSVTKFPILVYRFMIY